MDSKKVWIGSDHAGYALKTKIIEELTEIGFDAADCGCGGERTDYPLVAKHVGQCVINTPGSRGILVCGTGIGMSIAANKIKGIRAALCSEPYSARFTRMHNDANILCLGARVIGEGLAMDIVHAFLTTPFEGGRHAVRVGQIDALEEAFGQVKGE